MAYKRQRLADMRKAAGYTQERLAEALGVDRTTVVRWERAETEPQPWHRPHLSRLLGISTRLLTDVLADVVVVGKPDRQGVRPAAEASTRELPFALGDLRAALTSYRWGEGQGDVPPRSLDDLEVHVQHLHEAYQRANYKELLLPLPLLFRQLTASVGRTSGTNRRRAQRLLAAGYILASKLASKAGDRELTWLAADRAAAAASGAEARALSAVAVYQVGCAFLKNPTTYADAETLAATTADDLASSPPTDGECVSARGSLLLLAALAAAQQSDHRSAARHLAGARTLAEMQGVDLNHLWTGFGPTNVRIHEASVAVALNQPDKAIAVGEQLEPSQLPLALMSRRAQIHLDLAAACARSRSGDALAVLHLLEVERGAPQVLQVNAAARAILQALLGRERRRVTPGLRPLAQRVGALT